MDITTFELLKERLLDEYHGRPPPPMVFATGMLSSCVAQFVSYPLALVRTRMQVCICCCFQLSDKIWKLPACCSAASRSSCPLDLVRTRMQVTLFPSFWFSPVKLLKRKLSSCACLMACPNHLLAGFRLSFHHG